MDELIDAMETWLKAHPNPRAKALVVGKRMFSAEEILDEMKKGTRMGKMFKKNIMQYATEMFMRYNPEDD